MGKLIWGVMGAINTLTVLLMERIRTGALLVKTGVSRSMLTAMVMVALGQKLGKMSWRRRLGRRRRRQLRRSVKKTLGSRRKAELGRSRYPLLLVDDGIDSKRDWVAIYDECANVLYQEIDYTKEAANVELFASNFKDLDYIKVPSIYWEYTTPQVLTMEYVSGIKINRIQALDQLDVDRQKLGRYVVESYLEQILSHGFFHADPHPGNIAVDDVNGGRLIFFDFGMMGSISPNIREGLLEVFYREIKYALLRPGRNDRKIEFLNIIQDVRTFKFGRE